MFLKPQLCLRIESLDDLELDRDSYVMQPKYDGWRAIAHIWAKTNEIGEVHKRVTFYSRAGNILPAIPVLEGQLTGAFPADTVLDGELFYKDWNTLSSLMKKGKPIAEPVQFYLFDVLRYKDNEARGVSWEVRNKIIADTAKVFKAKNNFIEYFFFSAPTFPVKDDIYETLIESGAEGVVVKKKSALYRSGQRRDWFKLKPYQSSEMKVERIEEIDEGRTFFDWHGHKCYSPKAEAREVKVGDIIEVQHDGIKNGTFRNPRFARIRRDR